MMKFVWDGIGNYLFFVPLVGITNALFSGWSWSIFVGYAMTSVLFALFSGRAFTYFLTKAWWPLGEKISKGFLPFISKLSPYDNVG